MEALQLCTLLLPPTSRRKLQLLMRMMSRISQNVDMPRLHTAIGTRTLVRTQTRLNTERDLAAVACPASWESESKSRRKRRRLYSSVFPLYSSPQMIHTFSGCVLGSAVECDLDELLATRLVSFLMDHQQSILSVPEYLLNAINSHVRYLRSVQVHTATVCALCILASCRLVASIKCVENQQKKNCNQKKSDCFASTSLPMFFTSGPCQR